MFTDPPGRMLHRQANFVTAYWPDEVRQNPNEILALQADLAAEADVFRFDGSDLMPSQVGAGTFWTEMTAWISGEEDLETALQNIEDSWPTS